jgi:hypothetical protein
MVVSHEGVDGNQRAAEVQITTVVPTQVTIKNSSMDDENLNFAMLFLSIYLTQVGSCF